MLAPEWEAAIFILWIRATLSYPISITSISVEYQKNGTDVGEICLRMLSLQAGYNTKTICNRLCRDKFMPISDNGS